MQEQQDDFYAAPDADLGPRNQSGNSVGADGVGTSFGDTLSAIFDNLGDAYGALAGVAVVWAVVNSIPQAVMTPAMLEENPGMMSIGALLTLGLLLVMPLVWGYAIQKFHNTFEGAPGGDEMEIATSRYFAFVGFGILTLIMTMVGSLFCLIPGLILGVIFYSGHVSVILEERGPIEGIKRSFDLFNEVSDWFYAFGLLAVVGVAAAVVIMPVAIVTDVVIGGLVAPVVGNVVMTFVVFPAMVVLYYMIFRGLVARAEAPMMYEQGPRPAGGGPASGSQPSPGRGGGRPGTDGQVEPSGSSGQSVRERPADDGNNSEW